MIPYESPAPTVTVRQKLPEAVVSRVVLFCFVVPTPCGIWLQMRSGPEREEVDKIRMMMRMRRMAMRTARGLFSLWAVKPG